ncbi:DUF2497 domain-containing protein [Sphingomonas sp. GlSt437]|uniref:DUF2497 domain-containing protein n=1 Tax=Sphingomonas sp. GlSt437 TaxID=3389970 RepID=UPI003A89E906
MGDVSAEPSMEDILSSIKRIIAEEGESAVAARTRRPARAAEPAPSLRPQTIEDDILELSDAVTAQLAADPVPAPQPQAAHQPDAPEPIVSPQAAQASRGALDTLSKLVVRAPEEAPGENTLEALVRELLRPMLREWLDARLPGIVETMVAREIARITSQH